MASSGIRSGDRVKLVLDYLGESPAEAEGVFLGIDTGRDGVTPEAVLVEVGHHEYRHPFANVLIERLG